MLVTDAIICSADDAKAPHWNGALLDVRQNRVAADDDELGRLFDLAPAPAAPAPLPLTVFKSLAGNGAQFVVDDAKLGENLAKWAQPRSVLPTR